MEEIGRVIKEELEDLEPGCVSTIVGGYAMLLVALQLRLIHIVRRYRRGKLESNDVDIVFTHPDGTKVKGLCKRFVRRLYDLGGYREIRRSLLWLTFRYNRHGYSRYAYEPLL